MKIRITNPRLASITLALVASFLTVAHADTFYWDANGATAGFGTASGTWATTTTGGTTGWSTDSTGASAIGTISTTTADDVYFGFDPNALGSGTIAVSGTVSASDIRFGNTSGAITLTGGTISMDGGTEVIQAQTGGGATASNPHTIDSDITKSGGILRFGTQNTIDEKYILNGVLSGNFTFDGRMRNNTGVLTLNGLNSFTGNVGHVTGQINANTLADSGVDSSLGAGDTINIAGGGGQAPALYYTGLGDTSTNRTVNLNGGGAIRIVSQDAQLTLSGPVTGTSGTFQSNLVLSGDAGDTGGGTNFNEISGEIGGNLRLTVANYAPVDGSAEDGRWALTGANIYTGNTTVAAGTLSLGDGANNTTLDDGADVIVEAGAVLDLNYTGTDTIDELFLGGVQVDAGIYDSTHPSGLITGTGSLTVTTGLPIVPVELTWDTGTGDGTTITEGPGTWQVGTGNWNDTGSDLPWVDGNDAIFGGGIAGTAGTVTLGGDVAPKMLTFNPPNDGTYTVDLGSSTLTTANAINAVLLTGGTSATITALSGGTFVTTHTGGAWNFSLTGSLTIDAQVTGSGKVFTAGAGNLTLTNPANDFTGLFGKQNGGILSLSSIADNGVPSAAGAGDTVQVGYNAQLVYTGLGDSTNRTLQIFGNNSTLRNNGSGALVFTGNFLNTTDDGQTNGRTFTLRGTNTSAANEIQGSITDSTKASATSVLSVTKADGGFWTLSGASTYTGATTVANGTLQIGDGGTTGSLNTASAITINADGTLCFNRSDTVTQGADFSGDPISGTGTFEVKGGGTVVLNNNATFDDGATVSVESGSTLELNFAGTDTIDRLFLGGVQVAAGTYDMSDPSGLLTGTGELNVTTGPPPSGVPNIIDIEVDGSGNVILTLDGSEAGLTAQQSDDLTDGSFVDVASTAGSGTLTIDAADADPNTDGDDYFRVRN